MSLELVFEPEHNIITVAYTVVWPTHKRISTSPTAPTGTPVVRSAALHTPGQAHFDVRVNSYRVHRVNNISANRPTFDVLLMVS